MPFVSSCPQEGSRRGQKVPQSIRSGAQGPVVHCLPLEKSLPALPWLKEKGKRPCDGKSVRDREWDGWWMFEERDFYQEEDINQGPRAITKNSCSFTTCFVFTFNLLCFFPKEMQSFCIFVPWSWKLKSAMVLTVGRLWPCDVLSLQYSPTLSKGYSPAPVAPLY